MHSTFGVALVAILRVHVFSTLTWNIILANSNMRVPRGAQYPAECYLIRAAKFKPMDPSVQILYGLYLDKVGRVDEAIERYKAAIAISPRSAEAHYNLGLLYLKQGELESSAEHAVTAYELGYPLMGLKKNLISKGAWPEDADG